MTQTSVDASVSTAQLFTSVSLGALDLANRVVMAPLTRLRSGPSGVPGDLLTEYYRQRASVGMITTEGVYPNFESQSYVGQPGIATDEQAGGWRLVADAVHNEGGVIVMQIMHGGRSSHPDVNGGRRVVAPSAIAIEGEIHTEKGKQPYPVPHAMTIEDIKDVIEDHVSAARRAIDAGIDGVELHGANGYLLHEFLSPTANQRTDEYGGLPANRARFVIDVVDAVVQEIGADRVGLRISPQHNIQDALETDQDDVLETYGLLLEQVRPLGLAYLSVLHADPTGELVEQLQRGFCGPLVANSGFNSATSAADAAEMIQAPFIDAVAVGRPIIANPDLVERWKSQQSENEPRPEFFYAHEAEGYTDYPFL